VAIGDDIETELLELSTIIGSSVHPAMGRWAGNVLGIGGRCLGGLPEPRTGAKET